MVLYSLIAMGQEKCFLCVTILVVTFATILEGAIIKSPLDRTSQLIVENGYNAEIHSVITEDGYILRLHRIPESRNRTFSNERKPVVLLMHGIAGASDNWILLGPFYSVAFNLADAGFDVWMGNARGNKKSRVHVDLSPSHFEEKFEFFDFTWEEIGTIDIPAMIDYVLEQTGREKLHYIGHSQGGTVYLVMNSMRPEYNDKIASAHLMAGVGYVEYFPNRILRRMAANTETLYALALRIGFVEVYWENSTSTGSEINCVNNQTLQYLCEEFGINEFMRSTRYGLITTLLGSSGGAALKQFAHYGQIIEAKTFRRWDYGPTGNMAAYGVPQPPPYNLGLITVNTTMHYTLNDEVLDERDVLAMVRDMPNAVARKVARDSFTHTDFVGAVDAKELVTDYIIEAIDRVDRGLSDSLAEDVIIETEEAVISGVSDLAKLSLTILIAFLITLLVA